LSRSAMSFGAALELSNPVPDTDPYTSRWIAADASVNANVSLCQAALYRLTSARKTLSVEPIVILSSSGPSAYTTSVEALGAR
jgi:hypothetical protein